MKSDAKLENLEPGTHIKVWRSMFWHHGVYVGSDRVIHHSGLFNGSIHGKVESIHISAFSQGQTVRTVDYRNEIFTDKEIVERASSLLEQDNYCVIRNNCEHFATWCCTGRGLSKQVNGMVQALSVAGLLAVVVIGRDIRRAHTNKA